METSNGVKPDGTLNRKAKRLVKFAADTSGAAPDSATNEGDADKSPDVDEGAGAASGDGEPRKEKRRRKSSSYVAAVADEELAAATASKSPKSKKKAAKGVDSGSEVGIGTCNLCWQLCVVAARCIADVSFLLHRYNNEAVVGCGSFSSRTNVLLRTSSCMNVYECVRGVVLVVVVTV